MTTIDDIALPDADLRPAGLDTSTNQGKLIDLWNKGLDVWWRVCSHTGLTKLIAAIADGVLSRPIPKLDANWLPTKVNTSGYTEIGALPQNVANIRGDVAGVKSELDDTDHGLLALKTELEAVKTAVAGLSSPTLTDAQVASLAAQIAAAIPAAPSAADVATAVMNAIKAQTNKIGDTQ